MNFELEFSNINLLYFILVSPVVFVTTILFRDPNEEIAYPRFKAIIYLMQYCNHSLNFIFYGKFYCKEKEIKIFIFIIINYSLGITSPPYRRTLCEWFELMIPHLPRCCQGTIRRRSKTIQTRATTRIQVTTPQQIRLLIKNDLPNSIKESNDIHLSKMTIKRFIHKVFVYKYFVAFSP